MMFSIIIPVYNVAPYLRECLDSVLAQTFTDWEAICVDDGSTDGSGEILDEYAAKDPRFKVIHQQNGGEGAARNAGLAVAQGEWVFFLDGDDVMAPGALQRLDAIAEDNPTMHLIRFEYEEFNDGENWPEVGTMTQDGVVLRHDISTALTMKDFYTYVWQHAYRRKMLDGMRFRNYKRGCDRVFVDDVILNRVDSYVSTSAVLYGYRKRAGSAMNSVPSGQVLMDEMWHRCELVRMIDASSKRLEYARNWWLEHYFPYDVMGLIQEKSGAEQRQLWRVWYECLRELKEAKGFSRRFRWSAKLCCIFPCRPCRWMVCNFLPWYLAHGILPQIRRWVRRILV